MQGLKIRPQIILGKYLISQSNNRGSIGFPDWNNIKYIEKDEFPYTCHDNGYIYANTMAYYSRFITVFTINEIVHPIFAFGYNTTGFNVSQFIAVSKGDIIKIHTCTEYGADLKNLFNDNTIDGKNGLYFIPAKK